MALPVILNPAARSTRAGLLQDRFRRFDPAPELHFTQCAGDAKRLARELAQAGHRLIVAAGGDGTVNEAVNGLAEHNAALADPALHAALGVLPAGTMNVFAHELGLPKKLEECWRRISRQNIREVDLWRANDLYFVQLAGIGLDAEIVKQTPWTLKKRFGPLSYLITAARVLRQQPSALSVEIDGRPLLHGSIVLVGNGRHYGGPVPVFRDAKNDDGLLDIIIFHRQGALEALQFISALTISDFQHCNDLDYIRAREFNVRSEAETAFELDGEFVGHSPVIFKPAPFRLKIAV